jgi:hypothetical protein
MPAVYSMISTMTVLLDGKPTGCMQFTTFVVGLIRRSVVKTGRWGKHVVLDDDILDRLVKVPCATLPAAWTCIGSPLRAEKSR